MNYGLAYSSVGFYQISKLFCIPTAIFLERIFNIRQQPLSLATISSLLLITVGMILVIEQELSTNLIGLLWTAAGIISTASAQVFFGPLKKGSFSIFFSLNSNQNQF
jgi:hypothetical protein